MIVKSMYFFHFQTPCVFNQKIYLQEILTPLKNQEEEEDSCHILFEKKIPIF